MADTNGDGTMGSGMEQTTPPGMMGQGMGMGPGMMGMGGMGPGMMNPGMMNPGMMNPGMMNPGMMHPGMMVGQNMMSSMTMPGAGLDTSSSAGTCAVCDLPIIGQVQTARDKLYHPEHFVCDYCSQPIGLGKWAQDTDGKIFCEVDWLEIHAKRCHICNQSIQGKCVKTSIGNFHPEHFICLGCGTNMVGKKYKIDKETKKVFCSGCMEKERKALLVEAHMCAKCNTKIEGDYLLINGQFMHPRHYRCHECGCEFKGGDAQEFEGDLYCTPHYEALLLKKCARCSKPIKGRSFTALGKVWHPEHFTCHVCDVPFGNHNFQERDGLAYCKTHYVQLYGDNCAFCKTPIHEFTVRFEDKTFHKHHFFCNTCEKVLDPSKTSQFTKWEGKQICKKCYGALPEALRKTVEKRVKEEQRAKERRQHEEEAKKKAASKGKG